MENFHWRTICAETEMKTNSLFNELEGVSSKRKQRKVPGLS